jgi:hypothetical protein
MMQRPLLASLAVASVLTCAATAQVPFGFLVTAEANNAPDGFRLVDPVTGAVTEVSDPGGNFFGGAKCVAIDGASANSIVASAGGSFGGAPIWNIPLTNNYYHYATLTGQGLPLFGSLERMYATPTETLFTLGSVSDGLYTLSAINGNPTLLTALTNATDIAVMNGKAYVNSYDPGQPSTIVEVDLTSQVVRTVGTGYPTIRSVGTWSGMLMAGREDGGLDIIDVTSGVALTFSMTGLGSLIAIAEGHNGNAYVATSANEVYHITDLLNPIYSSPHTLMDIDVGRANQPTQVVYGSGCAGAGTAPEIAVALPPALGSTYSIGMTGGAPASLGGAVLGLGRANTDLASIGYPGCTLVADLRLIEAVVTSAAGDATTSLVIPNSSALIGTHINSQFFVLEPGGNLAMTPGLEGHVR